MKSFEFMIAGSQTVEADGKRTPDAWQSCLLPDEATVVLDSILDPYSQNSGWYFDNLLGGLAPWAIVCLDREYAIAGHVAESRLPRSGVLLAGYKRESQDDPGEWMPAVGVLLFKTKEGLEEVAERSYLFKIVWEALKNRPRERRWILVLDPLPEDWLAKVLPGDEKRWLERVR